MYVQLCTIKNNFYLYIIQRKKDETRNTITNLQDKRENKPTDKKSIGMKEHRFPREPHPH